MGLDTTDERTIDPVSGLAVADRMDDPFATIREIQSSVATDSSVARPLSDPVIGVRPVPVDSLQELDPVGSLAVLDDPRLVLTEGYVGVERRRTHARARLVRATHATRRRLLRLDVLVVATVAVVVVGTIMMVSGGNRPIRASTRLRPAPAAPPATAQDAAAGDAVRTRPHTPTTVPPVTTAAPAGVPAVTTTGAAATVPAAPPATPPATPPAAVPDTPDSMGAAALALVRYPWQSSRATRSSSCP